MSNPIWFVDDHICKELDLSMPIMIIIGPTGSGKTTLANYLSSMYSFFAILTIYTTRKQRLDDKVDNYGYVKESTFFDILRSKKFFMARINKKPFFGYLVEELKQIASQGKIPILIFRSSGFRYFIEYVNDFSNIFLISLQCNPSLAEYYSCDLNNDEKSEDIKRVLRDNKELFENFKNNSNKIEILNDYTESLFTNELLASLINSTCKLCRK